MVGGGVSKSNERNDHLRNDHKSQDGIGESNPGCRPRTSKEAAHENVPLDRKLDGADPISGKYFRHYSLFTFDRTDLLYRSSRELFIYPRVGRTSFRANNLPCCLFVERKRLSPTRLDDRQVSNRWKRL